MGGANDVRAPGSPRESNKNGGKQRRNRVQKGRSTNITHLGSSGGSKTEHCVFLFGEQLHLFTPFKRAGLYSILVRVCLSDD